MKIIEKCRPIECEQCGCIMVYEANDIKNKVVKITTSDFFKTHEKLSVNYINCPCCNKEIEVGHKFLT